MKLKLGTVQFHHRANDKAYNLAVIERFALEAAAAGVKILAFPEMCVTGYWHVRNLGRQELGTLAEPVPDGASTMKTMALARELDMAIGVGLIECANDGGLFVPDSHTLYSAQVLTQQFYAQVMVTLRELAGGGVIMLPSSIHDSANSVLKRGASIGDQPRCPPIG
jgi:predicted amidohydrolase